jgi:hypothetical protein
VGRRRESDDFIGQLEGRRSVSETVGLSVRRVVNVRRFDIKRELL